MKIFEAEVEIDDLDNFLGRLDSIADSHNTTIQGFDARYVVSRRHIEEAVEKARRAFDRDENVARELGMEILLYAAGTRQIDVATEIGLDEGGNDVVFVVVGDDGAVDDAVQELEGIVGNSDVEEGVCGGILALF
ncbi:MAG: KEOPS complex subunit Cgi121, partial [Halobacteria archaeon]|nr:KEOPS complex subunit Cgi121 [Halobacteria archaeon]